VAALLALGAAACWGVGDFCGGLASRRTAVLVVLAISQGVGLAGVLVWAVVSRDGFPGVVPLLPAVAGGAAGVLGLAALYRGFAVGAIGIVAPISAAWPIAPLAVDATRGIVPSTLQWLGIGLVLVGVVALSLEGAAAGGSRLSAGAGLALLAALGFGGFIVGLDAGADESANWAVVAARAASVTLAVLVALVTSTSLRPQSRRVLPLIVACGLFDTSANVLVAVASNRIPVGVVAVLGALYPILTVVLARIVLGERLSRGKRLGGAVALAGAALVASG
jgi:drug/metabolite transporter (DMT)-like permease